MNSSASEAQPAAVEPDLSSPVPVWHSPEQSSDVKPGTEPSDLLPAQAATDESALATSPTTLVSTTMETESMVVEEMLIEESENWDADLDAYSRRSRTQNLLGIEHPVTKGGSSERPDPKDKQISWEEQGAQWRKNRKNRPKWKPAVAMFGVPEALDEKADDEEGCWQAVQPLFEQFDAPLFSRHRASFYRATTPSRRPPPPPPSGAHPPGEKKASDGESSDDEHGSTRRRSKDAQAAAEFERQLQDFDNLCAKGRPFIKHVRYGFPHAKLIRVNPFMGVVDWGSGSLNLREALEIKGVKLGNVDPRLTFAVVCPNRTLELQASSEEERDLWVQGLRNIRARLLEGKFPDLTRIPGALVDTKRVAPPAAAAVVKSSSSSAPTSPSSGGAGGAGAAALTPAQRQANFVEASTKGTTLIKHGRHGKPHTKVVRVNHKTGDVNWGTGRLNVRDAVEIVAGKNTKLFAKVKIREAHPRQCFSIVLPNRTLDLQCSSEEERDMWLQGLLDLKKTVAAQAAAQPEFKVTAPCTDFLLSNTSCVRRNACLSTARSAPKRCSKASASRTCRA